MLSVQPLAASTPKALMMRTADVGGGMPTTEFAPAQLVIEASVDARFTADPA
jgi:hypothetical protein